MKMKILVCAGLVLATMSVSSCKKAAPAAESISSVSGQVVDATMNNIMLRTEAGDTVNISTMDTDPDSVPGVLIDDKVTIEYETREQGENTILQATKLSITEHSPYFYIQGNWVEPNPINASEQQGFTLNPDGTASSIHMATLTFKNWKLERNNLILTSESIGNKQSVELTDTLCIDRLDADSLILSKSGDRVWQLGRDTSASIVMQHE